jgi:hypothetical protein
MQSSHILGRVFFVFTLLSVLHSTRATDTQKTACVSHEVSSDGNNVTMFFDHPDVGLIVATKMEIVAPGYAEFLFVNGALKPTGSIVEDAHCAFSGSATGAPLGGVILFTCGQKGPRITVVFSNSSSLHLQKTTDLKTVMGNYIVTSKTGSTNEATKASFISAHNDEEFVTKGYSIEAVVSENGQTSMKHRSLLTLPPTPAVLYFDYVFVSDELRLANYNGSEYDVKADTIEEVAIVNAIFLVGNRFTPQIQFRIKDQIVWANKPSQMSPLNVGTNFQAPGYPTYGEPLVPADGTQILEDFALWIFETTFFNFTGYISTGVKDARDPFANFRVTGPGYDLGQTTVGWHLLSGESVLKIGATTAVGYALADSVCIGKETLWTSNCEQLFDSLDYSDLLTWKRIKTGVFSGNLKCYPNQAIGFSSMLNTPLHSFPGFILAHELGHNLGFRHVYNGGDQLGNVDNCLTDNPHNGSAVMGLENNDGSIIWSQCSVNKFNAKYNGLDRFGQVANGGSYSCADYGTDSLDPTYNPVSVRYGAGQEDYLHHLKNTSTVVPQSSSPPPTVQSSSPPPTLVPSPPGIPIVVLDTSRGSDTGTVLNYTINLQLEGDAINIIRAVLQASRLASV